MSGNTLSVDEYKIIAETVPVMIWRSNACGEYDYFNKTWLEFRGRTLKQEIKNGWMEGIHPEDLDRYCERYRTALEKREMFGMDYRLLQNDGTYRWIYNRAVPFYDASDNFTGYIGSCVDVTVRVELEQELQSARIAEVNRLRRLLPICSYCKKIRDDHGYWQSVEQYIAERSSADFTHSLCPDCRIKFYPNLKHRKK